MSMFIWAALGFMVGFCVGLVVAAVIGHEKYEPTMVAGGKSEDARHD